MAKAGRVGRDWGWLGGMLWGPKVEGLLRSAWKPRDNSVERAGAVSGAERERALQYSEPRASGGDAPDCPQPAQVLGTPILATKEMQSSRRSTSWEVRCLCSGSLTL